MWAFHMALLDFEVICTSTALGCCIYEKPRLFDESSSEESEDDDPFHKHKHRKQKAKHEQGCPMHDHSHDHDGEGKQGKLLQPVICCATNAYMITQKLPVGFPITVEFLF